MTPTHALLALAAIGPDSTPEFTLEPNHKADVRPGSPLAHTDQHRVADAQPFRKTSDSKPLGLLAHDEGYAPCNFRDLVLTRLDRPAGRELRGALPRYTGHLLSVRAGVSRDDRVAECRN